MTQILEFLKQNLGTLAVLLILVGILTVIAVRMIRNKKRGVSSCGCGCSNCPMSGQCHAKGDNHASDDKKS